MSRPNDPGPRADTQADDTGNKQPMTQRTESDLEGANERPSTRRSDTSKHGTEAGLAAHAAAGLPDPDAVRIAEIRRAIASGAYQVNVRSIASKLLDRERDLA